MSSIENQIVMSASPQDVFAVVSKLEDWPRYLPHYRWNQILESHPDHQLVRMACYRRLIPIDWTSRYHADPNTLQLHFEHVKKFTRGMKVVWHLDPVNDGKATRVTITHDMDPVIKRWGNYIANDIIGKKFIDYVATRTLKHFAQYFQRDPSLRSG